MALFIYESYFCEINRNFHPEMIEASLISTLRTILIIVVCWYVFKFILRLLAPFLMKKMAEKMSRSMHQSFDNQTQRNQEAQNNSTQTKPNKESKKVGEYIDFEEIE
jgi:hypothetical protein